MKCILSSHVDDLKGGAPRTKDEDLIKHLERDFGDCKQELEEFTHTGIRQIQNGKGIYCHHHQYCDQLRATKGSPLVGRDDPEGVDDEAMAALESLFGGVAWMVLTRAGVAVYVQALQRRSSGARVVDCRRLDLVLR